MGRKADAALLAALDEIGEDLLAQWAPRPRRARAQPWTELEDLIVLAPARASDVASQLGRTVESVEKRRARLMGQPGAIAHGTGTRTRYAYARCRCEACQEGNTAYVKVWREGGRR